MVEVVLEIFSSLAMEIFSSQAVEIFSSISMEILSSEIGGNIFQSSSSHHSTTLDTTVKLNKGESTQKFSQFIKSSPGFFTRSLGALTLG